MIWSAQISYKLTVLAVDLARNPILNFGFGYLLFTRVVPEINVMQMPISLVFKCTWRNWKKSTTVKQFVESLDYCTVLAVVVFLFFLIFEILCFTFTPHSLIRGILTQSCSARAKNFTKCVFYHVQFSGLIQNIAYLSSCHFHLIFLCRLLSK